MKHIEGTVRENQCKPWLTAPQLILSEALYRSYSIDADVIVVGAGIAGASVAYHCAESGLSVVVLECEAEAATAGSGNRQGMLYVKLSPHTPLENGLALTGFQYTLQLLTQLTDAGRLEKGRDWDDCGLLQLAYASKKPAYQQQLADAYPNILQWVDQESATALAGISLRSGGLLFPDAGWVAPQALTKALLQHPQITFLPHQRVIDLYSKPINADTPLWEVMTEDQVYQSKIVVLAMAGAVSTIKQCRNLPLMSARGQTTSLKQGNALKLVVSGEGYIAPSILQNGNTWTTFGATFERYGIVSEPSEREHRENIAMLQQNSAELAAALGLDETMATLPAQLEGRVALRASVPGSLPVVGPIAQYDSFMNRFSAIRQDAKSIPDAKVPWELGLYLSTAHGARGMITAPLAGRMVRALLLPEISLNESDALPLDDAMYSALHPNRFYYQQLRSGKSPDLFA